MKNVLVILDGIVAKKLLSRMCQSNVMDNYYDVVYMHDYILPDERPSNFTFYNLDPTSHSKLFTILNKDIHTEILIALTSKDETQSVIRNIRSIHKKTQITVYNNWNIDTSDPYINSYDGIEVLANGLLEKLPNIPVVAQNIGMRQGEIMEIRIPFGSTYAYRYIGSIVQKEWKIFGIYRNEKLLSVKPSLVIKPNDIIMVIGKPAVLMQVYSAATKTQGQFPMPFGNSLYLFLDMYVQESKEVYHCIEQAKMLHQKLKDKKLVIKITRPTSPQLLRFIIKYFEGIEDVEIEIDYHNLGFSNILQEDIKRFDAGAIILANTLLQFKEAVTKLLDLKIPIFKLGRESLAKISKTIVLLNDTHSYEQISPVIFDVSGQLKTKIKLFSLNPLDDSDKDEILEHFENLSKIFSRTLEIVKDDKNPIRELKKQKNSLQILPLKKDMFNNRLIDFFTTDSDMLSFDMNHLNQLLIPVVEE